MLNSVDIIYGRYLSDNKEITIGGVQTYITDLCKVIRELGLKVRIVQFARENYVQALQEGVFAAGFKIEEKNAPQRYQRLYDAAVQTRDSAETLTIFATDTIIPKKVSGLCIAIQHGIFWDIPRTGNRSLIRQIAGRAVAAYKIVDRLRRVNRVVCVDYNFLNWYRTQVNKIPGYATVIPNYASVAQDYEKKEDAIKIIFARRLFTYRGTRVFTEAVRKLLDTGVQIEVTIAGTGEDEAWMQQQLKHYDSVRFMTYESHESLEIHKDKHIAVVPTVGSEGTSLSLLEAMSAQCAVVCSNVGGMTNIVIDGFNGLMVDSGSSRQLYEAMKQLIENAELRKKLAHNGYETVRNGFSYEKWREKWEKVIKGFMQSSDEGAY